MLSQKLNLIKDDFSKFGVKVIFGDLTSIAQDLLRYFHTWSGTTLITALPPDLSIKKRPAGNVIDQDYWLGSNQGPPDL